MSTTYLDEDLDEEFDLYEKMVLSHPNQTSYTAEEVIKMSQDEVINEFIRIVRGTLNCTHCKVTNIREGWVEAVYRRCSKIGINKNMNVPKTCDIQMKVNDKSNKHNNPAYYKLRRIPKNNEVSNCLKREVIQKVRKIVQLRDNNISVCPYRYLMNGMYVAKE